MSSMLFDEKKIELRKNMVLLLGEHKFKEANDYYEEIKKNFYDSYDNKVKKYFTPYLFNYFCCYFNKKIILWFLRDGNELLPENAFLNACQSNNIMVAEVFKEYDAKKYSFGVKYKPKIIWATVDEEEFEFREDFL